MDIIKDKSKIKTIRKLCGNELQVVRGKLSKIDFNLLDMSILRFNPVLEKHVELNNS